MSLFDFPRIHFSGNIDIDVPTINNAYYFPLTIYDATRSEAFLPPRLYFSNSEIVKSVKASINPTIYVDENNGYVYIEIEPINTIDLLRTWCMTPIGSDPNAPDAAYCPYYQKANTDLAPIESADIFGYSPGYWNMYGDMGVKFNKVGVTGVQTFDGQNLQTWTKDSINIPAEVYPFLKAAFDLDTAPNTGITTATMVETISSQSIYANIFCTTANLYEADSPDNIFLQGTPFRFSALIYSAWRVLDWFPPMAGSARFVSSIPIEQINGEEQSALIQFFNNYQPDKSRQIKGVFLTFTVFEVFENRYDQDYYKKNGTKSNAAQSTTVGSITPWYEGDMQAGMLGRNLISQGMKPIFTNKVTSHEIPLLLTPVMSNLNELGNGTAIFSLDMGNSWPESISPKFDPQNPPTHRGNASFETMNLGTFSFRYSNDLSTEIASIQVNPVVNPRKRVFETGCVFDFLLTDPSLIQKVRENYILGFFNNGHSDVQILQEAKYTLTTDQKGLYADQGDAPANGYRVFNETKEPCRIRIMERGKLVTDPIKIGIAEYIVPEAANDPLAGPNQIKWQFLSDNDIVQIVDNNLELNNNAVYYFVYDNQYSGNKVPPFDPSGYTVMDTGSFVCLRVHPAKDYSQYLDSNHPNYVPPTFNVVYEEVFKLYDVVYPIMALIHPFKPEIWDNGTMAGLVVQRTDPSLWNNILYMPRSRELSSSQRELLKAWAGYIDTREAN